MDITGRHYATFEQLRAYCYRVASVVGLVSIEIFGYRDAATRQYAVDLGLALQLTNIIRDIGVDLDNGGRIYLPFEDLERFGYTPADLPSAGLRQAFPGVDGFRGRTRGGILSERRRAPAANRPTGNGRGRDHARDLLAVVAYHRTGALPGIRAPLPA